MPIIPYLYRSVPRRRPSTHAAPAPDAAIDPAVSDDPNLAEPGEDDLPEGDLAEEEQLNDAAFYRSLRASIDGVKAGTVPSITDAMRPPLQARPRSKRYKRRDRFGVAR